MRQDTYSRELNPAELTDAQLVNVTLAHVVIIEEMAESGSFDAAVAMADCMRMRELLGEIKHRFGVQPIPGGSVKTVGRVEYRTTAGTQSWVNGMGELFGSKA